MQWVGVLLYCNSCLPSLDRVGVLALDSGFIDGSPNHQGAEAGTGGICFSVKKTASIWCVSDWIDLSGVLGPSGSGYWLCSHKERVKSLRAVYRDRA